MAANFQKMRATEKSVRRNQIAAKAIRVSLPRACKMEQPILPTLAHNLTRGFPTTLVPGPAGPTLTAMMVFSGQRRPPSTDAGARLTGLLSVAWIVITAVRIHMTATGSIARCGHTARRRTRVDCTGVIVFALQGFANYLFPRARFAGFNTITRITIIIDYGGSGQTNA